MRASRIMAVLTAATATAVVAGCGSSSGAKTGSTPVTPAATSSPNSPSATGTPVTASGITGQTVCDAVSANQVEAALNSPVSVGTADDPKAAIHACGWIGANGKGALVTVVFDNPGDRKAIDRQVRFTNDIAGTDFSSVNYVTADVREHEVTVYRLSNDHAAFKTSGLDPIASAVKDLVRTKAGAS